MREDLDAIYASRLEHEKLEALKELAYGASHEINNPLANIAARAQSLLADEKDPERRRKLTAIHRQALRAHEMIADLMLFARPPKLKFASCDLSALVARIMDEQREAAVDRNIALDVECGDRSLCEVSVDTTQIGVALKALITNSIEAVGANGGVRVTIRGAEIEGKEFAEINVRDDGPGISPQLRDRLFDPFFSGREAGRGLGFGLSKCWRIVTDHGGRVVVNDAAKGADITLFVPVRQIAAAA
jgi:signal transduction histidine kinase